MKILITGVAGFIGFSLAKELLRNEKIEVFGVDNYDDYYSKKIKKLRISELKKNRKFKFKFLDITNRKKVFNYIKNKKFKFVVHLAAQAGVRFSQFKPKKYLDINIFGFINIIDSTLKNKPEKYIYASSSSVYGDLKNLPAKEFNKLQPINVYAMTKKVNETIAKFYSNYHDLNFVGLRYFTVYGEWGRPDMFLFKLYKAYFLKEIFFLNNSGEHKRDFTYIGDVVKFTKKIIFHKKKDKKNLIFNICSNNPIKISKIIDYFKNNIGYVKIKKIGRNKLDVKHTHGSNSKVKKFTNIHKFMNYKDGIKNSFKWYKKNKLFKIK